MPALDGNRRARDELPSLAAQPETSPDHIARFSDPAEGDASDDVVLELVQRRGHHLGREGSEGEGVDIDAVGG